jgi:hypothetical protein
MNLGKSPSGFYRILYTYQLEFIVSGTSTVIDSIWITDFICTADYENMFANTYTIKFQADLLDSHAILDDPYNLIAKLSIKKYKELVSMTDPPRVLIDEYTDFFIPAISPDYGPQRLPSKDRYTRAEDEQMGNMMFDTVVHLKHWKASQARKKNYNRILGNATVLDALRSISSYSDLRSIIDIPDGKEFHNQIIILPGNLKESLKLLNKFYPTYIHGMAPFVFDDILYIMKANSDKHELADGDTYNVINIELTTLTDESVNENASGASLMVTPDGKDYDANGILTPIGSDVFETEILGTGAIGANALMTFKAAHPDLENVEGGIKDIDTPWKYVPTFIKRHTLSGDRVNLLYDKYNNFYNISAELKKNSRKGDIEIVIPGGDMEDFMPNKTINLSFKDTHKNKKYGGRYYPLKVVFGSIIDINRYQRELEPHVPLAANVTLRRFDSE